jgi:hypothetical protein
VIKAAAAIRKEGTGRNEAYTVISLLNNITDVLFLCVFYRLVCVWLLGSH